MVDELSSPEPAPGLQRFKDKAERKRQRLAARMERLESKISRKMSKMIEKMPARIARLTERRERVAAMVRRVTPDSPKKLVLILLVCMAVYPIASSAWIALSAATAVTVLMFNMLAVCLTPASMFLGAGLAFFQPVLLGTISSFLTALTALVASMIAYFPRARSLLGLLVASLLPFFNAWVAMVPAKTFEVVKTIQILDPLRPLFLDPVFRPLLPDMFASQFLDIVPNPFVIKGPVNVIVESTTATPYMALKLTVSAAAFAIALWGWTKEKERLKAAFSKTSSSLRLDEASVSTSPGESKSLTYDEEEARKLALQDWEKKYSMRPAPSQNPADWSTDDLCYMLEKADLAGCVEAIQKSKIDGRVALTLTEDDEEEIKTELGIERLGERRRLLLFLQDLRAQHDQHKKTKDAN